MATSLQQQLAAIAQKSTHSLDLKAQRNAHSVSLLFEPREAASQTFDTIFEIALDGFEDLCRLDSRFSPFAQNLYSEQSKSEDRTQMTTKENQGLDAAIQTFLGLISGRLLLKPAQKALEWLVRRFRIHEYNIEHFVAAFLPYHDDAIFATMLSLIPTSRPLPPSLKFLAPYMKSLAPAPRHAILSAAISNPSFFTLLNSFVLATARQRNQTAPLLGFWASITAQAINGQLDSTRSGRPEIRKQKEDEVLLKVIPLLQEAFQIKETPELYLGSCMIAVILATKIELADQVLDGLMDAVAGAWSSQTVNDGIACLSVLSLERDTLKLPRATAKKLVNTPGLVSRLLEVSARYSVDKLYSGVTLCLIEGRRPKHSAAENARLLPDFYAADIVSDSSKDMVSVVIADRLLAPHGEGDKVGSSQDLLELVSGITGSLPFRQCLSRLSAQDRLDVAALEGRLEAPLLLEAVNSQVEEEDEDVEMEDGEQIVYDDRSPDLESLRPALTAVSTFLDSDRQGTVYAQLVTIFTSMAKSTSALRSFVSHEAFGKAEDRVLLLSFLVRLWTTASSVRARQQALAATHELIQGETSVALDYQVLLPYLLCALGDPQAVVRRGAATAIKDVSKILREAEKKDTINSLAILGKDAVYAISTKSIKWMKASDVYAFLSEVLAESLDECIVDAAIVSKLLLSTIDGTDDDLELKTSTRSSLFSCLISHSVTTTLLPVRAMLLKALGAAGKASSGGRKQVLLPGVAEWIRKDDPERLQLCKPDNVSLVELDDAYINSISIETEDELELLKNVALKKAACSATLYDLIGSRLAKLWPHVSTRQQTHFTQELLNEALEAGEKTRDKSADSLDLLRQLRLSGDALVTLLQDVHSLTSMPDGTPSAKRRRVSSSKTRSQAVSQLDLENMVRRLTLVLELVEASKPERHPELLKHLFHALGDLQQVKSQLGSDLVYVQQMILSSLLSLVDTLKALPANKIDRSALRADLVVDCMRSTGSSQVHSSALLLISSMASWAPDLVLHSVMPIFTFMSNTILRQGDDYSAHIIDQTVSHVIPPLVGSLRKKNQDLITGAAELLLSFIAAFEHIPMHRRLQLFKQLVMALGPDESLSAVVAMLFERYPSDRRVPSFTADLTNQFAPVLQLKATGQYIDLVADSLQPRRTVSDAIFSFENATQDEILDSARLLISSLARFLSEGKLASQISTALHDESSASAIRQSVGALIDRSIGFAKTVEKDEELYIASQAVVAAVLNLLPTTDFVQSAEILLDNPEEGLGLRLLETLEKRTSEAKSNDAQSRTALLSVIPVVSQVLSTTESVPLKHASIACIDKIAEKFGKKDTSAVLSAATTITSDKALGSDEDDLRVLSLFALATLVEVLRDEMISILPDALNITLGYLRFVPGRTQPRLWEASFTFLTAVLDYIPWMLSSETLRVAFEASIDASAEASLSQPTRRARDVFLLLSAKSVEAKVLLTSLGLTLDRAFARSIPGCIEVVSILDKIVTSATKTVVSKNHNLVLSIVQQLFDVRSKMILADDEDEPQEERFAEFDRKRDAVLMKAVLKLNDATFRPWFVELAESASISDTTDLANDPFRTHALVSIYGFFETFFSSLKSLVTSYSTYILDSTVTLVNALDASTSDDHARLTSTILSTLRQTFEHDQDDFWRAPSHFNKITPALLQHLQQARAIAKVDPTGIIATISELASAASSADHLKDLNGQLLRLMRSSEMHVRLAAVKTQMALTEKLGEDWLALLPEMLPFISELQEDEDEEVERQTLAWIKGIEGILGESLEGMLQ